MTQIPASHKYVPLHLPPIAPDYATVPPNRPSVPSSTPLTALIFSTDTQGRCRHLTIPLTASTMHLTWHGIR